MPYLTAMAQFRNAVREQARELKASEILRLCDELRDDVLPQLGVRLEDREGSATSALKLVDRAVLLREQEAKKAIEAEKKRKKLEAAALLAAKEAQRRINPKEMFLADTDKYSVFDANVSAENLV